MTIPVSEFENLFETIRLRDEKIVQLLEQRESLKRLLDEQSAEVRTLRGVLRELKELLEAGLESRNRDELFVRIREWVRAQGGGR